MEAATIVNLLRDATEANLKDKFRDGSLIRLGDGELVITGDLHGHKRNFERIMTFADLENNPRRHLLLQEIIHGACEDNAGKCLSYEVLFEAVRYKLKFPDRIHFVLGNHDTAFICDREIIKNGREMNRCLRRGIRDRFDKHGEEIEAAMKQFLLSQPLALRCDNRIWISHSLPDQKYADDFDIEIMNRRLRLEDCYKPASAYLLTWGRRHSQQLLDRMAELFDVDTFVLGHQAQQQGYARAGENLLILASDHNHGCLLPISLEKSCDIEALIDSIVPIASIA